ncbi:hypothetical protein HDU97_002654, partial [Phlyctochytrium planicorne]
MTKSNESVSNDEIKALAKFKASSALSFEKHMEEVMIYASIKFPGLDQVFKDLIRVPLMPIESPQLLPPNSAPPVLPNNPTAAELEVYKEAVDAYEVKRNHDKPTWDEYCQRMSHWRHFSDQNAKAVSILHRCFSREDLERVSNTDNAVDKVEALEGSIEEKVPPRVQWHHPGS